MNERKLSKSELAKREDIILNMKGNKRDLVKKYGADAEKVMYGRATNMAKKQSESMNQTNMKLKEMVKNALKNPKKADLNKDGKLSDYEKTRGKAVEKNLSEGEEVIKYKGEDHVITRREGDRIYLRRKEDAAVLGRMPEFWVKSQDISEDLEYEFSEENPSDIEDYELEDEDMDNPDEDLVIIGSGYLDIKNKFKERPSQTNGEYAELGQKVVDQLHKGDKEAALDYIYSQINEDQDLGHEDNEPHMLKADLYRIGKYAMELYNIVDGFEGEGEVDFPSWWQAKITNAKTAIVGAKHYLDFEINEPKIDAVVDTIDDITLDDDAVDTDVLDVDIDESQLGTDDDTGFTKSLYTPNEIGDLSVGREYASGAFEESLKSKVSSKLAKKLKEGLPKDYWDKKMNAKGEVNDEQDGIGDGLAEVDLPRSLLQKMNNQVKSPATMADTILNLINVIQSKEPVDFSKNQKLSKVISLLTDLKGDVEDEDQDGKIDEDLKGLMAKGEKMAAFANKQSGYEGGVSSPVRGVLAAATVAGAPDFNGDEDLKAYWTRRLTKAIETQKGKKYMSGFSIDESYAAVVNKIKKSGKSEKAAKAIAGAVASYKAKGGGKGPTAKQK